MSYCFSSHHKDIEEYTTPNLEQILIDNIGFTLFAFLSDQSGLPFKACNKNTKHVSNKSTIRRISNLIKQQSEGDSLSAEIARACIERLRCSSVIVHMTEYLKINHKHLHDKLSSQHEEIMAKSYKVSRILIQTTGLCRNKESIIEAINSSHNKLHNLDKFAFAVLNRTKSSWLGDISDIHSQNKGTKFQVIKKARKTNKLLQQEFFKLTKMTFEYSNPIITDYQAQFMNFCNEVFNVLETICNIFELYCLVTGREEYNELLSLLGNV